MKMTRLSNLSDMLGFMVLACPDRFPKVGRYGEDQEKNLDAAFANLREGLPLLDKKLASGQRSRVNELVEEAFAAYKIGERKRGAHLLQDIENIAFPNRFAEYEARKGEPLTVVPRDGISD
jgi:hypothetical protein